MNIVEQGLKIAVAGAVLEADVVVPDEPGTLEQVARLARDWLLRHLKPVPRRADPHRG
jgi:hypothetical protein